MKGRRNSLLWNVPKFRLLYIIFYLSPSPPSSHRRSSATVWVCVHVRYRGLSSQKGLTGDMPLISVISPKNSWPPASALAHAQSASISNILPVSAALACSSGCFFSVFVLFHHVIVFEFHFSPSCDKAFWWSVTEVQFQFLISVIVLLFSGSTKSSLFLFISTRHSTYWWKCLTTDCCYAKKYFYCWFLSFCSKA